MEDLLHERVPECQSLAAITCLAHQDLVRIASRSAASNEAGSIPAISERVDSVKRRPAAEATRTNSWASAVSAARRAVSTSRSVWGNAPAIDSAASSSSEKNALPSLRANTASVSDEAAGVPRIAVS